jgi:DNA-binding CsgD family transcriptional regulator
MSQPKLLERAAELAVIDASLQGAQIGEGSLILVEGPAGAGKSALLAEAAARARASGMEPLIARGGEYERGLGFEIVRQLFARAVARDPERRERVLTGAAATAAPLLDTSDTGSELTPIEARHALYWLVANLADETPVLLIVDDLQWADPSSQAWIYYLTRRLQDLPVCVIAGCRTDESEGSSDILDRLRDEPLTRRLGPAPLSPGAVAAMFRSTLDPTAGEAVCEAAHRLSGGNPFLLHELVRAMAGAPPRSVQEIESARPESIARGVTRRLAAMPESTRALADAVSILGDGCELRHAAALAGLEQAEAILAADQLSAAAILAPDRPVRFEHPLVRAAVHDAQGNHRRDQAHLEAARILAAEGETTPRIASHLLSAPALADPWIAEQLESAGLMAYRRGALVEAAELLERALQEPPAADRRAEILLALARAEHLLLRSEAARGHLEDALASASDLALRAEAGLTLAQASLTSGDFARMTTAAQGALDDAAQSDRELYLRTRALASNSLWLGDTERDTVGRAIDDEVEQLQGASEGECLLLGTASLNRLITDETPVRAIELAERAVASGLIASGGGFATPPLGSTVMTLLACDRIGPATKTIEAWLAAAGRQGSLIGTATCLGLRCSAAWTVGELAESEADGRSLLAIAADLPGVATILIAYLARTLADRGAVQEAAMLLADPPHSVAGLNLHTCVSAHVLAEQGRHAESAAQALELADSPVTQRGMSCVLPWRLQAALSLSATGDHARAQALLSAQRPITERWGLPRALGALQRAEGLVRSDPARLQEAVDTLAESPARLELARTLIDLGAMQRRLKQRATARETLRRGLDLAQRCAADGLVARAGDELAACGARPRRLTLNGLDSLTASERRVARLAAEGRSNPEIAQSLYVSRKTVEAHLGSVYRKLDISSRDALPALLVPVA